MDTAQLVLTLIIPMLLSLVAYLGHRSIQKIDDDISEVQKTLRKVQDNQLKMERFIDAAHAENRVVLKDLEIKIDRFKLETYQAKEMVNEAKQNLAKTDETQGKILLILNKVVTELKRKKT